MIIEKMKRQEGKTTKIIEMVKKDKKSVLVVAHLMAKKRICKTYNLNPNNVCLLSELNKISIKGNINVYIDDIGECLQIFLNKYNLKYATHTDY